MRDRQRFESLRKLAPREAVQAWLNGEFGIDDEPALIEALRRDPRVIGSDDQIIDTPTGVRKPTAWRPQDIYPRLLRKAAESHAPPYSTNSQRASRNPLSEIIHHLNVSYDKTFALDV